MLFTLTPGPQIPKRDWAVLGHGIQPNPGTAGTCCHRKLSNKGTSCAKPAEAVIESVLTESEGTLGILGARGIGECSNRRSSRRHPEEVSELLS
jgi:hypothetical protein